MLQYPLSVPALDVPRHGFARVCVQIQMLLQGLLRGLERLTGLGSNRSLAGPRAQGELVQPLPFGCL